LRRPLLVAGAVLAVALVALAGVLVWADLPYPHLPAGAKADRLVVLKGRHELLLLSHGRTLATYRVALGKHPAGPKQQQGDGRTPEGLYFIDYHKPDSSFYRALHLSYPSAADWKRATARGVDPGGAIMIHGVRPRLRALGRLHRLVDWTDGCIAVTNPEMDQIFAAVSDGTPVELRP
jgi:murein L,D-transpeptidase YafK